MTRALVIAVALLLLSVGIVRMHPYSGAIATGTAGVSVAATTLLFLLWGRIELALAATVPVALTFTATLGTLGWLGQRVGRPECAFLLICLLPAASLSLILLGGKTRIYRGRDPAARWMTPMLVGMAIVGVASDWFLARKTGAASNVVGISGLVAMFAGCGAVMLILWPATAFLMPHEATRVAPAIHLSRAGDSRARVRSLYRYLDVSAEQYVTWKLRLDPIFAHIDEAVPSSGSILDAGCGFGIMSNLLAMSSAHRTVIGIDQDERKLRIARRAARTLGNVHYLSADLIDTDYPPADCVLLIDALHYWSAEKQSRIIERSAKCLRPGGVLIFREGMRDESAGHRLVHWAERGAVWLGHNPRGDGLQFQSRDFYLREFARHGLDVQEQPTHWGRGSNAVLILRDPRPFEHDLC